MIEDGVGLGMNGKLIVISRVLSVIWSFHLPE